MNHSEQFPTNNRSRRKGIGMATGVLTIAWGGLIALAGCGKAPPAASRAVPSSAPSAPIATRAAASLLPKIDLPQADQRLGTAVVVVVDTSGSMSQKVPDHDGARHPKHVIAQAALRRIIDVTAAWQKQHADAPLYLGMLSFSSQSLTIMPIGAFDAEQARAAVDRLPPPAGGTAIGRALEEAFKLLYSSGCIRKHVVCITDGENTVSTPPDLMARQLFAQTKGEVEIHFMAFDTSARHFAFLKDVNGSVVEAADGAQLQARLVDLYEKRILVEAMPAERE